MSLDVYLIIEREVVVEPYVPVRVGGTIKRMSPDEYRQVYGLEPFIVDEDLTSTVYSGNITHNLTEMADAAGLYGYLWRPDENGITTTSQLAEPLSVGLAALKSEPNKYIRFNPKNGWGSYDVLVNFVRTYLEACKRYPNATVSVWR